MARRLKKFTSAWAEPKPVSEMPRKVPVSKYRSKQPVGAVGAALLVALQAKGGRV